MKKYEFIECEKCSSKSGLPELCSSCYSNRRTIEALEEKVIKYQGTIRIYRRLTMLLFKLLEKEKSDES